MLDRKGNDVTRSDYVRNELTYRLDRARFLLSLWDKVGIVKKKDGTPYKDVARSIKNATYVADKGNKLERHYPKITVSGYNPESGTEENDSVDLYYYIDEDYYEDLTVRSAVFTRKANLELDIRKYEQQLGRFEEIYSGFFNDLNELFERLYDRCDGLHLDGENCLLEYLLVDVMLDRKYTLLKSHYHNIFND